MTVYTWSASLSVQVDDVVKPTASQVNGYFFLGYCNCIIDCLSSSLLNIISLEIFLFEFISCLTNAEPKLPVPPVIK